MIAHICDLEADKFVHIMGDTHIYLNHTKALEEQIMRTPKNFPKLQIKRKVKNIEDFKYEDFKLTNYKPLPVIKMKMAI